MNFIAAKYGQHLNIKAKGAVQLIPNNWDDYSYKTQFAIYYIRESGELFSLGDIKVGHKGQGTGWTRDAMDASFKQLPDEWFSIGLDVDYYVKVLALTKDEKNEIMEGLRDVAFSEEALAIAESEEVYITSLMRGVSEQVVRTQYRRVLNGGSVLTDYSFSYVDDGDQKRSPVKLSFKVEADSKPPSNIHVLIGRNGIGKTTVLNGMVAALHPDYASERTGEFRTGKSIFGAVPLGDDVFSGLVSVSFSVFDPFIPPPDKREPSSGPKYAYLGMKSRRESAPDTKDSPNSEGDNEVLKTERQLIGEFAKALRSCMSQTAKRVRWLKAIERLESDGNFAAMRLQQLAEAFERKEESKAISVAKRRFKKMSSGHKIVLLTITALVYLVEERTLLLLDEPESHLHPPLLAAFTRALSEILQDRNGVAIVATHSPVMVQEVPRLCVWKISRSGLHWRKDRPTRETFAENVGILTTEVFGLEVSKSGFHALFQEEVNRGLSFDEAVGAFEGKIGMEGLSILASMIASRDALQEGGPN